MEQHSLTLRVKSASGKPVRVFQPADNTSDTLFSIGERPVDLRRSPSVLRALAHGLLVAAPDEPVSDQTQTSKTQTNQTQTNKSQTKISEA